MNKFNCDVDRYGTPIGFDGGYESAINDIMDIMNSTSDLVEAATKVRKFIIKYKADKERKYNYGS